LKPVLLAAGLAAFLPALGSAQGLTLHRKPGMWQSTMVVGGRTLTTGLCTDEAFEKGFSVINPREMGAQDCSNMTPKAVPGGYRVEGACSNGGRTSHLVATIKGDLNSAYTMDTVVDVDGKPLPAMHVDTKWTGACTAGLKPGDMYMLMPNGQRVVMHVDGARKVAGPGGH
jgi:hypothetical protein